MISVESVNEPTQRKGKRDLVGMFGPTMLAVVVTLAMQIGGYVWWMATTQQRLLNVETRQQATDDVLKRLPEDYIPRVELTGHDLTIKQQRDEDQRRLDRIEAKIDLMLENSRRN